MTKRTPLFAHHMQLEAKVHEFAGYDMPIEYAGIIAEHTAVRQSAGIFDVSHMGEIEILGTDATAMLQHLTPNDVTKLVDGKAQYSMFLNERGGVIDDIIIYRHTADHYLLIVNASNVDTDWHWLLAHQQGNVVLKNRSESYCLLALQGPVAEAILQPLTPTDLTRIKSFHFVRTEIAGLPAIVARTGYTGEPGFELLIEAPHVVSIWTMLLKTGAPRGLQPCGLGARDTLRLEMGYRLHGHDMNDQITPLEASLDWVVKLDKGDFIGRTVLQQQRAEGLRRRLVGLRMCDPGIPREGYSIVAERKPIGYITSGTMSPSLRKGIGLGYVPLAFATPGTKFFVDIRGKERLAEVTDLPFYRKNK